MPFYYKDFCKWHTNRLCNRGFEEVEVQSRIVLPIQLIVILLCSFSTPYKIGRFLPLLRNTTDIDAKEYDMFQYEYA